MDVESSDATSPAAAETMFAPGTLWSVGMGIAVAVVGFIDGLVMWVKWLGSPCSSGYCDPSLQSNPAPHPTVAVAVMAFSVMLGILIHLAGRAVHAARRGPVG